MKNTPLKEQNREKKHGNASIGRYIKIFAGVKMPWLILILAMATQITQYVYVVNIASITGSIVDASGNVETSRITDYVTSYAMFALMMIVTSLIQGIASEQVNLGLREKLWKKLMYIPQRVYDKDRGETLVSRITTDCNSASGFLTALLSGVGLVAGLIIYMRQMLSVSRNLTLYTMLLLPVSALIGWLYGKARYWIGKRTQGTLSEATTYLIERTQNLWLIKAASTETEEDQLGRQRFEEQYKADVKLGLLNIVYLALEKVLYILGIAIAFIGGGALVSKGILRTGQVVAFYMFTANITNTFANFISTFGSLKQCIGSLEKVIEVSELQPEDVDAGLRVTVPDADIALEDVTFGYTQEPVLQGLSCVIPKNKTTAIIGANGCGKTTLLKLLKRFYEPEAGGIYFGGTNIQKFSLHSWRKAFALVAQERPLMEGTIRENITYGCQRDVSQEELEQVAQMARVDRIVENLPDGFDSYVAPGGKNFSGGQRQCIAIARAIMHNPDYLLLDEATSNLDAKSERVVIDAMNNLMKGRTTIMIAHSLSGIRHADHVIVMKEGRVIASGSPEEIIHTSNEYRDFVMQQRA